MKTNLLKRTSCLLIVGIMCMAIFAGCTTSENRDNVLKIYTWADYNYAGMEDDFVSYYKDKTGLDITVELTTFTTNEEMLTKIEAGKEDYDVVAPSDYMIQQMISKNLLQEIKTFELDNYNNISSYVRDKHAEFEAAASTEETSAVYSVSYMWGTMGFVYNESTVTGQSLASLNYDWSALFSSDYKNKTLIKDSMRDTYVIASIQANKDALLTAKSTLSSAEYLSLLTETINDTSSSNLESIKNVLINQKADVKPVFEVDEGKGKMSTGDYDIGLAWSGDAIWAIEEAKENGVELGYAIPEIGSNLWFDGWVIPTYAANPELAHYFIDFALEDDTVIANMEETGYTSGVATKGIYNWLTTTESTTETVNLSYFFEGVGVSANSMKIPEYMYPSADKIQYCAIMADFGNDTEAVAKMWSSVKSDSLTILLIVATSIVCAGIIAFVVVIFIKKRNSVPEKKESSNDNKAFRRDSTD